MERPDIWFNVEEPSGGFDYVKPEPKQPTRFELNALKNGLDGGLKNLFKR